MTQQATLLAHRGKQDSEGLPHYPALELASDAAGEAVLRMLGRESRPLRRTSAVAEHSVENSSATSAPAQPLDGVGLCSDASELPSAMMYHLCRQLGVRDGTS